MTLEIDMQVKHGRMVVAIHRREVGTVEDRQVLEYYTLFNRLEPAIYTVVKDCVESKDIGPATVIWDGAEINLKARRSWEKKNNS
jgi:hypothetical protein